MDRDMYNAYKSIVSRSGETVKGNIINYMQSVIDYEIPNADTLEAIREVEDMKANPAIGKVYTDVDKMMEDLLK